MLGDAADGADLDVARRRQLEVDLAVEDVAGERPEAQPARRVRIGRGVAAEAHAVADAVGAVHEGVVDQLEVGRLAGVDRDVEVALPGERQRLGVQRRREPGLGAGEVERRRPSSSRSRSRSTSSGDLQRAVGGAHRAADHVGEIGRPAAAASASPRRSPAVTASTAACGDSARVQLGREADLGVHDAVGGEVDDGLGGDPLERAGRLQHGERVLERRQVLQEVAGRRRRA